MTQYKIENTSDHIAKCDGLPISEQVTGNVPLNAIVTLVTYLKNA